MCINGSTVCSVRTFYYRHIYIVRVRYGKYDYDHPYQPTTFMDALLLQLILVDVVVPDA